MQALARKIFREQIQGDACELLGIEREEVELDLVGVESWEQQLSRRVAEAEKNGNLFDLCDSDTDVPTPQKVTVKSEKGASKAIHQPKVSAAGVIDLCDSDSDADIDKEKDIFGKYSASVNVKAELHGEMNESDGGGGGGGGGSSDDEEWWRFRYGYRYRPIWEL